MADISLVIDMPGRLADADGELLSLKRADPAMHAQRYTCGCSFLGFGTFPEKCPEHPDGISAKELPVA